MDVSSCIASSDQHNSHKDRILKSDVGMNAYQPVQPVRELRDNRRPWCGEMSKSTGLVQRSLAGREMGNKRVGQWLLDLYEWWWWLELKVLL